VSVTDLLWQRRAACRGADPSLFYGPWDEKPEERESREANAKAICAECPVRRQCLMFAVTAPAEHGTRFGVWGQAGERERAQIRRNYLRRQRGYAA
jgi:WhiB family transcriptional regulator, redox-sensing transcriptional regulator